MSSGQIIFFKKNFIDLSNEVGAVTVSAGATSFDGAALLPYLRNRNNMSAWTTTGALDAYTITLTFDFGQNRLQTDVLLVKHNFKAFTVKYSTDGSTWSTFSTPIAETVCTDTTSRYSFTQVTARYNQITITGTQTANAEKYLYQYIATKLVGQLAGWPVIKNPVHDRGKKMTPVLSNKVAITEGIGSFGTTLEVTNWKSSADLTIVEDLYFAREGRLMWLCGDRATQFSFAAQGYRREDIYFVRPVNNYSPEWARGIYKAGMGIQMQLKESIT